MNPKPLVALNHFTVPRWRFSSPIGEKRDQREEVKGKRSEAGEAGGVVLQLVLWSRFWAVFAVKADNGGSCGLSGFLAQPNSHAHSHIIHTCPPALIPPI